jgi:putative endonuclease
MFTVYVLLSEKFNKIYIGYTSDLEKRFISHNKLGTKGWTIKFRPWKIVHTEAFQTKAEAMKREKELKSSRGRKWIRDEIIKE